MSVLRSTLGHLGRLVVLLLLALIGLQLYFVGRIALMAVIDPQSTTFQRSEAWRLLVETGRITWSQQWVDDARLSAHLKRAVIASEDATFADHTGVDWDAAHGEAACHAGPAAGTARAAQGGGRLDDHATAGQEPAALG
jgi:membrane peptidoglycan carboxypeptidase